MFGATLQLALLFNATIFNYRELRTELIVLNTRSSPTATAK